MKKDPAIDTAAVRPAPAERRTPPDSTRAHPDARSRLLTVLAGLWMLDGLLQLQPYMFTKDFGSQTIAPAAQDNPGWVGDAVTWAARLLTDHPVTLDTAFALIQLALGIGIAYRPTRRVALAASIPWACSVWLFGEGLGGLLTGEANPLTGAPGSALLYALCAVLLWPASADAGPFPAAGALGAQRAKIAWSALWIAMAYLTLQPTNRAPSAFTVAMTGGMMSMGEPRWYTSLQDPLARLTLGHDLAIAIILAVLLALIAASVWLPATALVRAGLVAAMVLGLVYWVCGQAFGMPFMGMATDPNSGPLLVLLAACFWPGASRPTESATRVVAVPDGAAA